MCTAAAHDDHGYDDHIYDTKGKYGSSSDRVTSAGVGMLSREGNETGERARRLVK